MPVRDSHDFPIPSYQRQRTPERHNADAPRSPEIIEQEDMGRLCRAGVVGVYGGKEPEERKGRKPGKTTSPQEGRPLRILESSVTVNSSGESTVMSFKAFESEQLPSSSPRPLRSQVISGRLRETQMSLGISCRRCSRNSSQFDSLALVRRTVSSFTTLPPLVVLIVKQLRSASPKMNTSKVRPQSQPNKPLSSHPICR